MRTLKFLTWLDVKRLIREKTLNNSQLPTGIHRIDCFSDAVEISTSRNYKATAESILQEWFGDWYQKDQSLIRLDFNNANLPIVILETEENPSESISIRPFWEEILYAKNGSNEEKKSPQNSRLPGPYLKPPFLVAFYSFKGGVGRTIHLAAHLFALLESAKELDKGLNILIIDADLEAPGLTYWDRMEKQQAAVSFIQFLEAYHYSPLPIEETLDLFVQEVKKTPKYEGKSTFYFLPACLEDEQLLDTPVLPEHLARSLDGEWSCADAIYRLGQAVGADYILIDLRAGLSEISSPLIFDPRIQRFFVSTATEQSVSGISLVLSQVSHVAPSDEDIDNGVYYDPSVIISFLTPELKSLPGFENALFKFNNSYIQSNYTDDSNIYSKRLKIKETDFAQELLYINSWEEAKHKLSNTSIMRVAEEWAQSELNAFSKPQKSNNTPKEEQDRLNEVRKFRAVCEQYEFAEKGFGRGLLVTEPLKNLASQFRFGLPRVVSIGAKGAGKTFLYIQLSRFKYWEDFLEVALKEEKPTSKTHVFPFLQSRNLDESVKEEIAKTREELRNSLGNTFTDFIPSEYVDKIQQTFQTKELTISEWNQFWIEQIALSIGIDKNSTPNSFQYINGYLKEKQTRIIFLFDGLEDIFSEVASNEQQRRALESLIMNIPEKLGEIRQANLGVIILLRRDFVRYAIIQNAAQFESRYRSFDLSWNVDSFLKLVYWVCSQAKIINALELKVDTLERGELVEELKKLWGEKLGGVREAYTANWVFAALTDFKGRLQARDIVRFLFYAADETSARPREIQFDKWSDRILPPQAIRHALEPCSEKKVEEATAEYPDFKAWVEQIENLPQDQKRVPFTADDLNLDKSTIRMLEDMGVIFEDRAKDDDVPRYYMPEIFRTGLDFTLEAGKRPRVLVLKRKALGGTLLGE